MDFLEYSFMQRALVAAVLVGLAAPTVGVHLVQRRLALIGDGIGHVALAGVAIGVLTSTAPVLTALVCAAAGAVSIELIRAKGRTSGDIALAILFYGGIAGGVVIISQAPGGTPGNLNEYLFGAITTTTRGDLIAFADAHRPRARGDARPRPLPLRSEQRRGIRPRRRAARAHLQHPARAS